MSLRILCVVVLHMQVESKLRADYGATVVVNWGYWIPAQVINFRFVAPVYQVCWSRPLLYSWIILAATAAPRRAEGNAAV